MANTVNNYLATFKRQINTVSPDGAMGLGTVTVALHEDGQFSIPLPSFICESLNFKPICIQKSLEYVVQEYEAACERYSTWRLGKRPTPALAIVYQTRPRAGVADEYGLQNILGLGLVEVCFNGTNYTEGDPLYRRHDHGELFGERLYSIGSMFPLVVDDTPEIRAQYERLAASFETARGILESLDGNPDPLATFMSIKFDGNPGAPAAETKTNEPAAPAQAELPLTTSTDDEEL